MKPATILIVDNEPYALSQLQGTVQELDSHRVETASNGAEVFDRMRSSPEPDLILLDIMMRQPDALQTLERLRQLHPKARVVVVSPSCEARKLVQAIRLGADEYLVKPANRTELESVINRLLRSGSNGRVALDLHDSSKGSPDGSFFIAAGPGMREMRAQAENVAKVDVPVLLLGESGTGKEAVARLIHKFSPRSRGPFLKVNCAALPAELFESELFGYEVGAFTGASTAKPGKFEQCNGGTILLDEIAEMPISLQAKLLHVLQDQQFARLGSRRTTEVDVRILAATNVDIRHAVANGRLRLDLYYRLNALELYLPPLRERREEIPLLFKFFVALYAARHGYDLMVPSPATLERCLQCPWPGNLRELQNFVKRYLILGEAHVLRDFDPQINSEPSTKLTNPPSRIPLKLWDVKGRAESEAISSALQQTRWHRKEAARLLNISYKTLLYKIRKYGLDRPPGAVPSDPSKLEPETEGFLP